MAHHSNTSTEYCAMYKFLTTGEVRPFQPTRPHPRPHSARSYSDKNCGRRTTNSSDSGADDHHHQIGSRTHCFLVSSQRICYCCRQGRDSKWRNLSSVRLDRWRDHGKKRHEVRSVVNSGSLESPPVPRWEWWAWEGRDFLGRTLGRGTVVFFLPGERFLAW